ncbi:MAG: ADP-forming succinate--CoA ligase subunit beta [Clostridia bacterium]|nr:ADP-forming succinate--CoA ligase subunit beta [Clostridia bacterium]
MKIHEYQAKELLRAYGAPVPPGEVAATAEQAAAAAEKYGRCVLKAQVHSGGRGKAGGVRLAENAEKARALAGDMLGMRLATNQTGPEGKLVRKLLVTPAVEVKKEFYLCVTGDHENAALVIIASADGGTEIEETARTHPERIARVRVSASEGFKRYEGLQAAGVLGLSGENEQELISLLASMVRLYQEKDCSLVEINPLALTADGHLMCLDAKVAFDDNALFRHPELKEMRDIDEEDPREYLASQHGLNFVSLSGTIGCLVNGAGLAMATMDIIQHFGGEPANFLDVGGGASKEKVQAAFELLLSDKNVRAIFVNIFGGIMKCDVIAEGVVAAAREMGITIPLIVRLEGTNAALGKQILADSGLAIIPAENMADGARKAVEAARAGGDGA